MTRRFAAVLLSTLMLGACATMIDGASQEITLKTPGTDQGHCYLDNGVARWQIYSNQTIQIQRNDEDIVLTCTAPGNKSVKAVIDRDLNAWSIANITNGVVPGVSYDHFTGALYDYPKTITVDFSATPMAGYPLPQYEDPSLRPVNDNAGIEKFEPTEIRNPDRGVAPRKMDMGEIRSRSHPLGSPGSSGSGGVEIYRP